VVTTTAPPISPTAARRVDAFFGGLSYGEKRLGPFVGTLVVSSRVIVAICIVVDNIVAGAAEYSSTGVTATASTPAWVFYQHCCSTVAARCQAVPSGAIVVGASCGRFGQWVGSRRYTRRIMVHPHVMVMVVMRMMMVIIIAALFGRRSSFIVTIRTTSIAALVAFRM
jgi:hypothetical protein